MTKGQFEIVETWGDESRNEKFIEAALQSMSDKTDRTLIWGYTLNRDSFHVYLKNRNIYKVIYEYRQEPEQYPINSVYDVLPNKRAYPEACDFEFCRFIKSLGVEISFTTFDDKREVKKYHGEILCEHR
jgi:hypothetical protein